MLKAIKKNLIEMSFPNLQIFGKAIHSKIRHLPFDIGLYIGKREIKFSLLQVLFTLFKLLYM